jgi:hypothetical protein
MVCDFFVLWGDTMKKALLVGILVLGGTSTSMAVENCDLISSTTKRLECLQKNDDSLQKDIAAFAQRLNALAGQINALGGQINALGGRIDAVQGELDGLKRQVSNLPIGVKVESCPGDKVVTTGQPGSLARDGELMTVSLQHCNFRFALGFVVEEIKQPPAHSISVTPAALTPQEATVKLGANTTQWSQASSFTWRAIGVR